VKHQDGSFVAIKDQAACVFVHSSRFLATNEEIFTAFRSLISFIWQRIRRFLRHSSTHQHDLAMNEWIFTSFIHSSA
jgi:hypothetical protein